MRGGFSFRQRRRRLTGVAAMVVTVAAAFSTTMFFGPTNSARARASAREVSGRVVLIDSPLAPASARRCLSRIRDELVAGGFEVAVVSSEVKPDPISIANAIQHVGPSVASIAVVGDPDRGPFELWIVDRIGGRSEVRRIQATSEIERSPEVVAIRAMEVLRASALRLLVESGRATHRSQPGGEPSQPDTAAPAKPPPASSAPPAAITRPPSSAPITSVVPTTSVATGPDNAQPSPNPPAAPRDGAAPAVTDSAVSEPRRPIAIEAGFSLLHSMGGPPPGGLPVARLRFDLGRFGFTRLGIAGFGTRPRVAGTTGTAAVSHALAMLEVGVLLRNAGRVSPVASLGAGALYVAVEGEGTWPYRGADDSRVVAAAAAGVGLLTDLTRALALALEVHTLVAFPRPTVRFAGADAASIGGPSFIASATLVLRP